MARAIDWEGILAQHTDKQVWEACDGPESGNGVDYWFVTKDETMAAYLNIDQGYAKLSTSSKDFTSEGETVWQGELDDLEEHPELSRFVSSEPTPA